MLKFSLRLLSYDRKKTRKLIGLIILTLLFPCVLIFSMQNYQDFQLQNAYAYAGAWDIKATGEAFSKEEMERLGLLEAGFSAERYTAKVGEADLDSTEVVYLSLLQASSPEQLVYCPLVLGRYPENADEIVVPYPCSYAGKSAQDGTLLLGDSLTVEVGVRSMGDGIPTTEQRIQEGEVFAAEQTKIYTVVGFSVFIPVNGVQTVQAVTGLEEEAEADTFYYLSDADSCAALAQLLNARSDGSLEYNQSVYKVYYENGEAESAVAKTQGIRLVSVGAFVTCFFLCASVLLRTRRERKRQIQLLDGLGMSAAKRRVLYFLEWGLQVLFGAIGMIGCFYIYTWFLQKVLPRFFMTGLSKMKGSFHFGIFLALTVLLYVLGVAVLWREPLRQERVREGRKGAQLRTAADLSKVFRKRSRVAKGTVIVMATVSILAISLGVPLGIGIYKANKAIKQSSVQYDASVSYSGDFRDGVMQTLLEDEESVEDYSYRIYTGGWLELSEQNTEKSVWDFFQETECGKMMVIDGKYTMQFGVRGCTREEYELLRESNPHLPSYEQWCQSGTVLLDDFFNFSNDWSGESTKDNSYGELAHFLKYQSGDEITLLLDGKDEEVPVEMVVGQAISTTVLYKYPQILMMQVYVPSDWLAEQEELNVKASYKVQVRKGYEEQFNLRQAEWMTINTRIVVDYQYLEIMEANDGIRIHFFVVLCVVCALCALCIAGMYVMLRVDLQYQTKQFAIFRGLGMSLAQAMNLRMTERMNLLLQAVTVALAGNLLLYYGVFADYAKLYGITSQSIFVFWVVASLGFVLLGIGDSAALTRQQYKQEVTETQRQE